MKCCFQVRNEDIMNKSILKVGDVIRFHDWTSGGFLFGVIIEYEDKLYHNKLNIWRPRDIHFLQAVDHIDVIQSKEEIIEYELRSFDDIIEAAKNSGIFLNTKIYQ